MVTNRRVFLVGASASAALALAGCETEPKPSLTATLVNNDAVNSAVAALVQEADNLNAAISGFDSENWRDVVPDVRTAGENVSYAVQKLREALGYSK